MTEPVLPHRSAEDIPPDDSDQRASISEMRKDAHALEVGTSLLLEIAETGREWVEAHDALASAWGRDEVLTRATSAFDRHRAALRKVRR